jgi:hypothetical protein
MYWLLGSIICKKCYIKRDKGRKRNSLGRQKENASENARESKRRWNRENPDPVRKKARRALKYALEMGEITRPDKCEKCGSSAKRQDGVTAIQGHHHAGKA